HSGIKTRTSMNRLFFAMTLLGLVLVPAGVSAQSTPAAEVYRAAADRSVDILHIKLDLEVFLKEKRIAGSATIDFAPNRPIEVLTLDAVGHEVSTVRELDLDGGAGRDLTFENTGETL